MRVAYLSPLPPQRSGVADYSALLLPALRRRLDVAVVRAGARKAGRGADVGLYHVGNEPEAHGWIVRRLRRRAGVVVLHDFVLHHLVAGMTLGRGDAAGYIAALEREAGPAGAMLAHGVIDAKVPPLWETSPERFPLVREVLDHATGVIVHSAYVERRVRSTGYERPVWRIPHPAWPVPAVRSAARPLPGRAPLIASVGNLDPNKRIPQLLQAFRRVLDLHPRAGLVLGGGASAGLQLAEQIRSAGLVAGEDVAVTGYVDEPRLWSLLASCDVCVSLRSPTMGETSGSAIRALSLGKPLVVSDVGWFSELPSAVVAKLPVDEWEVELLAAILSRLVEDRALRGRMGEAALAYVRAEHDLDAVAERYAAVLEEAAGGSAVRDAVLADVARAAGELGLSGGDRVVASVGARLREAGVGAASPSTGVSVRASAGSAARRVVSSDNGRPPRAPPDFARRFTPPERAYGEDYGRAQADLVAFVLGRRDLVERFARGAELPPRFAVGFDERVIEYAWLLAQQPAGRTLDAGSTLNHAHVLDHFLPIVSALHVATLAPEPVSFRDRGVRYAYADLRELPYPDGCFDTVVSLSTLEHVGMETALYGAAAPRADDPGRELRRAMEELVRVLRPGGRLLVTVPYGRREDHRWFRQLDREDVDELIGAAGAPRASVDVYRYTADGWQRSSLAEAAGELYHDHRIDPETPPDRAAAARAVACIRFDFPAARPVPGTTGT